MPDNSCTVLHTAVDIPALAIGILSIHSSGENIKLILTTFVAHIRNDVPIGIGLSLAVDEFGFSLTFFCVCESHKLIVVHTKELKDIVFRGLHQTKFRFVATGNSQLVSFGADIPTLLTGIDD